MENPEIVFAAKFGAYNSVAAGFIATEANPFGTRNGDPTTGVSNPELTVKADIAEKFGTATNIRLPDDDRTIPSGDEPTEALETNVSDPSEPTEYDSTSFDP